MISCPEGSFIYTIQAGDTLWLISRRYLTTVDAIMASNPGINPNNLVVGQKICITPGAQTGSGSGSGSGSSESKKCPVGLRAYTIQQDDTLWLISQRYCTTVETIMALNPRINPTNLQVGQIIWVPAGYTLQNLPPWARSQEVSSDSDTDTATGEGFCPEGSVSYIIEAGDTLWLLSQRFHTTVEDIMAVNKGINPTNLFIGQVICIPRNRTNRFRPQPMTPPQTQPQPQTPTRTQPTTQPVSQPVTLPEDQLVTQPTAPAQTGSMTRSITPPEMEPPLYMWVSTAEQNLNNYIRLLWLQHVYWTRMAFESMIFNLPNAVEVSNRLMQNPGAFESALQTFYDDEEAAEFAQLLSEHLTIAGELVMALQAGDEEATDAAYSRWMENADNIAEFLASINPNWSEDEWQKKLESHLEMTKMEATDMLSQNYEDSISTFDDIEQEALEMADLMTRGIVAQFPQYFR